MKSVLICVAVLLCIGVGLNAQQYVYNPANTPSVGGSNSWPFNLYTGWRFSFIINKSVLGPTPFLIKDIAFAPSTTRTFAVKDFQMRMGHTTYASYGPSASNPLFDTILGPTPTEVVKRGAVSWSCTNNTWCDIGMTAPFKWNGTDNICCEIRYNSAASGGVTTHTAASIARGYTHTRYSQDPFNDKKWYVPIPGEWMGPIHRLTVQKGFYIDADATVSIGKSANLVLAGGTPADFYQIAASLGKSVSIKLGKCSIQLDPDNVFIASLKLGAPIFNFYAGQLSATGGGGGMLGVPNIGALVGITVYHSAISYTTGGITACANTDSTRIVR